MQIKFNRAGLGLAFAVLGLSGCSLAPLIGKSYGEPPPQVAYLGAKDVNGAEYLTWDRVSSFGPVPEELQAAGHLRCMKLGSTLRAAGYHPRALDVQGKPTPGGGFFCQPQPLEALQSSASPRVILRDGQPNWDRPSAFMPIPEALQAVALKECRAQNPRFQPLGYHPKPLDAQGQPMNKAGFLCAE